MKTIIVILVMFIGAIVPSIVIAASGYASIMALGRNPSAAPKIMLAMMIPLMVAGGIAVIALIVSFQVFGCAA